MNDECKTKAQLIEELVELRRSLKLSDSQKAEKELSQREERYRSLVEEINDVVYSVDSEGLITYVNPAIEPVLGYQPSEIIGRPIFEFFFSEDLSQLKEKIQLIYAGHLEPSEWRMKTKSGEACWVRTSSKSILEGEGIVGLRGVLTDITEHKKAENALKVNEEFLQTIYAHSDIGIFVLDVLGEGEYRYVGINPVHERLTGIRSEEVVGKTPRELECHLGKETIDSIIGHYDACVEKREMVETESYVEIEGKGDWWFSRLTPLLDEDGNVYRLVGSRIIITERKRVERELVRLERLRAVGELSAGVSHNLNNILTNVLGPAQLLKRKTNDPELLREVDDIVISGLRARDLVRELHLSVRSTGEESLHPIAVDSVAHQAMQTSSPRWKDEPEGRGMTIEMVTHWGGVAPIQGTEVGLHDILTNLIFNAVDAMPEGGKIDIRTQMVEEKVQIIFSDTGAGMDEETRRRVFEPFFTTKMDVGTGLGLSTVHNTVIGWGGTIEVDSAPGEGATFTLCFPGAQ